MSDISAAVKIEDISSVKKKLSFDIPWADVKNELDTVYRKVGKTAKGKRVQTGQDSAGQYSRSIIGSRQKKKRCPI